MGLSVIPLQYKSKKPYGKWARCQKERHTEVEVAGWFYGGQKMNIGIVTGAISGIAVIDCDSLEAASQIEKRFPTHWVQTTSKGKHFIYKHPGVKVKTAEGLTFEGIIFDVRGDGGYIVGPNSVHPDGTVYTTNGWSGMPADLPLFPLEILGQDRKPAEEHGTNTVSAAVSLERIKGVLFRSRNPNCGYDEWVHVGMAIHNGSNGSEKGFNLWDQWSASSPKYRGAEDLRSHWQSFGNSENPITSDFLFRADISTVEDFEDLSIDSPAKRSFLQSIGDFFKVKAEPDDWLVEGRLPAGGTSILAAKPKVGKSTLSRELTVCVAFGRDFLGWKTKRGPVLYFTLEESIPGLQAHFAKLGAKDLTNEIQLFYDWTAPADFLKKLEAEIADKKPALIVLDPLLKFFRVKDENNYAEVTAILQPIQALAQKYKVHVLVVHHNGKTDREDGDAVLGSTGIFASFDTLITLKKRDGCRMISTTQRYGESLVETTLSYDDTTGSSSIGVPRIEAEQLVLEGRIVEWLANQPASVLESEISKAVHGRSQAKRSALLALVSSGRIQRKGAGTRGDPFFYRCCNRVSRVPGDVFSCSDLPIRFPDEPSSGTENEELA
jgi:hypothetical protein